MQYKSDIQYRVEDTNIVKFMCVCVCVGKGELKPFMTLLVVIKLLNGPLK